MLSSCTYYMGNSWKKKFPDSPPPEILSPAKTEYLPPTDDWLYGKDLVEHWALKDLGDWKKEKKVGSPRTLIAKLMLKEGVEEVNAYLMEAEAIGRSGTSSFTNKKGDYDFTEIILCTLLYKFGDQPDLLYPETREHLLNNLMIDSGNKSRTRAPRTLGIIGETENHVLMTETSRYLKNQWLFTHGHPEPKFNNNTNGLETFLSDFLEEMAKTGFFEFNSDPYMGYTLTALLTLHAWTDSELLKKQSINILHEANFKYLLSSSSFRRYPPFRRRMAKASRTELDKHPHTIFMRIWSHRALDMRLSMEQVPFSKHHAFMAIILPYHLPRLWEEMIEDKDQEYFVRLGHGYKACPEIYSGGEFWVLSGGGVRRGKVSQISARHTVLMVEDRATDVEDCFYLPGKGKMRKWNNTGVFRRLAVGPQPLHVPKGQEPVCTDGNWKIYKPSFRSNFYLVTYSEEDFGMMAMFPYWVESPEILMREVLEANPGTVVRKQFKYPGTYSVGYDVKAPKNKWVITTVNGNEVHRKFDYWPRWNLQLAERR